MRTTRTSWFAWVSFVLTSAVALSQETTTLDGDQRAEVVGDVCRSLVDGYVFAEPTHLVDTFRRGWDEPMERWTDAEIAGRPRPDLPVLVLTSSRTASAAESFTTGR